ncbi:MAG TPA: methyl-accepting chemotaxis protein [Methylomusa anaerophila]|uniref:Methyl-accepting chemotaxis protein 4 n=1 Tax=Methylomusa anaerophila TaxID=1930071 RepID=A0A348AMR8_9FIRM|nr:methyl-accepting chemotaxis protein [Methylomusa anaerophila]BBB92366.1 methyl-accepting chemotaxis protein 4 [Methylomusa anaerophila]HML89995.1 methyl-accepting chemotaxis protein [Methylomusa anaerophila]
MKFFKRFAMLITDIRNMFGNIVRIKPMRTKSGLTYNKLNFGSKKSKQSIFSKISDTLRQLSGNSAHLKPILAKLRLSDNKNPGSLEAAERKETNSLHILQKLLGRFSLKFKLLAVVALLSLVTIGVGILGLHGMKASNNDLRTMYTNRILVLKELKIMSDAFTVNIIDTCHKVKDGHLAWALGRKRLDEGTQIIKQQWTAYKSIPITKEEERMAAQIDGFFGIADGALAKASSIMAKEDKNALSTFMIEEMYSSLEPMSQNLSELINLQLELSKQEYSHADERYSFLRHLFWFMIISGLGSAILLALLVLKLTVEQVRDMVTCVEEIAAGNLALPEIPITTNDEVGRLGIAMNKMMKNLRGLVQTVSQSAEQVVAASEETAASVQDVSATATDVAAISRKLSDDAEIGNESVVEVSKSLLELSSLVDIAKREATSAVTNSKETLNAALQGQQTVVETVTRMANIRMKTMETETLIATLDQYTEKIGAITHTITDIASQTNLLSLNAAIEAARAGEAGRGFAVVAKEVKKLAEQSSQGATEVAALIQKVTQSTSAAVEAMQASRTEVEEGVLSANEAGQSLENILTAVNNTVQDIEGVLEITDEEVTQSDRIIDLIDSLATVIENTAEQAKDVSTATNHTSTIMDALASNSSATNTMATDLMTAMENFTT